MKVGFIGVGNMGGPMCHNIIRNTNHEVVVFDLNPDALAFQVDRYLEGTAPPSFGTSALGATNLGNFRNLLAKIAKERG